MSHSNDNIQVEGETLDSSFSKSIYDFNDDSDRDEDCYGLSIDESPERKNKESPNLPNRKQRYQSMSIK